VKFGDLRRRIKSLRLLQVSLGKGEFYREILSYFFYLNEVICMFKKSLVVVALLAASGVAANAASLTGASANYGSQNTAISVGGVAVAGSAGASGGAAIARSTSVGVLGGAFVLKNQQSASIAATGGLSGTFVLGGAAGNTLTVGNAIATGVALP
jgi:hypothetical protein